MARYRGTALVDRSPDEVFAYLSDFSNVVDWDPSVTTAQRLETGRVRVGSRVEVGLGFLGQPIRLEYRVTELEAPHRVAFEAETESFRSIDTIEITRGSGGKTRIVYDAHIQLRGFRAVFDGAVQLAFFCVGRNALSGLRNAFSDDARANRGSIPAA